jgi:RNA polymerase sigma factor (sigma-70 family)
MNRIATNQISADDQSDSEPCHVDDLASKISPDCHEVDPSCADTIFDSPEYDAKLVENVLIGNQSAKKILVERLSPLILGCVKRLNAGNRSYLYEEKDFVQEIWTRLFLDDGRLLKQYDSRRGVSLEGYFSMVIQREIGNQLQKERAIKRGRNMTVDFEEDNDTPIEKDTPEQFVEARELAQHLDQRLRCVLSGRGIDVLHTAFLEGAEPSEIAKELKVSVQVVYNWLHKIRILCRDFLDGDETT